ncbi:MAG TPA: alpha/beta hydrolase [Dyadobacter sp.]|nr:alpha/beta hydrolase [Dyadobacter sp.]
MQTKLKSISNRKVFKAWTATAIVCSVLAGCAGSDNKTSDTDSLAVEMDTAAATTAIKPDSAAPAWAPDIKDEMLAVIEKLVSYKDAPISKLTAPQARQNHTPTDAVMDLVKQNNIAMPAIMVDTAGKEIPVEGGNIHARIYTPKMGTAPYPVIVYYHGGGFVIADLDVYDASARGLAEQTGAIVVSVAYRLAPEHKFPVAHDDAFAAYQWTLKNAVAMKGDAKKIAVAGESAGGNLAANVSIMARDKGLQLPVHQLLVYPVAGSDMNTESYQKYASAKPLDKPMMGWFVKNYLNSMAEAKDTRINLVGANLEGLPETTIITAEIDPLLSDGKLLAQKLKDAGVKVDSKNYEGVTHEFFGMAIIVPQAKDAQSYASEALKSAFKK